MKSKSYLSSVFRHDLESFTRNHNCKRHKTHAWLATWRAAVVFISCEETPWKLCLFCYFPMPWLQPSLTKVLLLSLVSSKVFLGCLFLVWMQNVVWTTFVSSFSSISTSRYKQCFLRLIFQHDQAYQTRVLPISSLTGLCRLMRIYVWDENLAAVLAVAKFTPPVSDTSEVRRCVYK